MGTFECSPLVLAGPLESIFYAEYCRPPGGSMRRADCKVLLERMPGPTFLFRMDLRGARIFSSGPFSKQVKVDYPPQETPLPSPPGGSTTDFSYCISSVRDPHPPFAEELPFPPRDYVHFVFPPLEDQKEEILGFANKDLYWVFRRLPPHKSGLGPL